MFELIYEHFPFSTCVFFVVDLSGSTPHAMCSAPKKKQT